MSGSRQHRQAGVDEEGGELADGCARWPDVVLARHQQHWRGQGRELLRQHGVRVEAGSLLAEVTGHSSGEVNSAHHQAIARLGEGLQVNCYAEDGAIEGIEWADPGGQPFLLAVQWHPERMLANGFDDEFLYRAIRDRFLGEVR